MFKCKILLAFSKHKNTFYYVLKYIQVHTSMLELWYIPDQIAFHLMSLTIRVA